MQGQMREGHKAARDIRARDRADILPTCIICKGLSVGIQAIAGSHEWLLIILCSRIVLVQTWLRLKGHSVVVTTDQPEGQTAVHGLRREHILSP